MAGNQGSGAASQFHITEVEPCLPFDNALRHQRRVLFADDKGRIPLQVLFFFVCILFVYVICVLAVITGYLISHRRKQSHTKLHEYKIISVLKSKCFFFWEMDAAWCSYFLSVEEERKKLLQSQSLVLFYFVVFILMCLVLFSNFLSLSVYIFCLHPCSNYP